LASTIEYCNGSFICLVIRGQIFEMFLPYQFEYWWAFQNQNTTTVIRSEIHLLVELVLPFELDCIDVDLLRHYPMINTIQCPLDIATDLRQGG